MKICKVKECNHKYYSKGYCRRHYNQMYKHGKILKRTRYDFNEIICNNKVYEIILYDSQYKEKAKTIIDKNDVKKVKRYKWCLSDCGYTITVLKSRKRLFLHHLIIGKPLAGYVVDHINHDPLDNRKCNLRFATKSQNAMNRKNAKGYYWNKYAKKWEARIAINKKRIHLGYFNTKAEVIKVRQQAELKYFKEFAPIKL